VHMHIELFDQKDDDDDDDDDDDNEMCLPGAESPNCLDHRH